MAQIDFRGSLKRHVDRPSIRGQRSDFKLPTTVKVEEKKFNLSKEEENDKNKRESFFDNLNFWKNKAVAAQKSLVGLYMPRVPQLHINLNELHANHLDPNDACSENESLSELEDSADGGYSPTPTESPLPQLTIELLPTTIIDEATTTATTTAKVKEAPTNLKSQISVPEIVISMASSEPEEDEKDGIHNIENTPTTNNNNTNNSSGSVATSTITINPSIDSDSSDNEEEEEEEDTKEIPSILSTAASWTEEEMAATKLNIHFDEIKMTTIPESEEDEAAGEENCLPTTTTSTAPPLPPSPLPSGVQQDIQTKETFTNSKQENETTTTTTTTSIRNTPPSLESSPSSSSSSSSTTTTTTPSIKSSTSTEPIKNDNEIQTNAETTVEGIAPPHKELPPIVEETNLAVAPTDDVDGVKTERKPTEETKENKILKKIRQNRKGDRFRTMPVIMTVENNKKESEEEEKLPEVEEPPFSPQEQIIIEGEPPASEYQQLKQLGKGRFGCVWTYKAKSHNLELAGKVIKVTHTSSRKDVEREIDILKDLRNHPQLISLYRAYIQRRQIIIFTELITGGELFERIIQSDKLTEETVVNFVRQILEGVNFMHSKNIIHRDLKPENILCKSPHSQELKIIDFGFAVKIEAGKEPPRKLAGTTLFMAPETINFDAQGTFTDMWSVGVITYNLLGGFTPFEKPADGDYERQLSDHEIISNIVRGSFDFDDEGFEDTSNLAKEFISNLLQPIPKKRLSASECLKHPWLQKKPAAIKKVQRHVSLNRMRVVVYMKKAMDDSRIKAN